MHSEILHDASLASVSVLNETCCLQVLVHFTGINLEVILFSEIGCRSSDNAFTDAVLIIELCYAKTSVFQSTLKRIVITILGRVAFND